MTSPGDTVPLLEQDDDDDDVHARLEATSGSTAAADDSWTLPMSESNVLRDDEQAPMQSALLMSAVGSGDGAEEDDDSMSDDMCATGATEATQRSSAATSRGETRAQIVQAWEHRRVIGTGDGLLLLDHWALLYQWHTSDANQALHIVALGTWTLACTLALSYLPMLMGLFIGACLAAFAWIHIRLALAVMPILVIDSAVGLYAMFHPSSLAPAIVGAVLLFIATPACHVVGHVYAERAAAAQWPPTPVVALFTAPALCLLLASRRFSTQGTLHIVATEIVRRSECHYADAARRRFGTLADLRASAVQVV